MDKDQLLTIIPPPGQGIKTGCGTRFVFADGSELGNVSRCVMVVGVDEILHAVIELAIDPRQPIEVQPLLGLETVKAAADAHGFELVKKVRGVGAQALLDAVIAFTDANMPPEEMPLTPLQLHQQRKI